MDFLRFMLVAIFIVGYLAITYVVHLINPIFNIPVSIFAVIIFDKVVLKDVFG